MLKNASLRGCAYYSTSLDAYPPERHRFMRASLNLDRAIIAREATPPGRRQAARRALVGRAERALVGVEGGRP